MIPGNFTWQNGRERCKKVSGKLKDVNFHDFCKTNSTKAWVGFGTVSSEEEYMKLSGKIRVTYVFIFSNKLNNRKCFISYTYMFTKSTAFRVWLSKLGKFMSSGMCIYKIIRKYIHV